MKAALFAIPVLLVLPACTTMGTDTDASDPPVIPEDAQRTIRTEDNGDVIEEYRVGGLLRIVKVTPARGPTYYMIDDNGDGRMDRGKGDVQPVYYKLYGW